MYCPRCKAEYRSGFTKCSDCDIDLVEHLSEIRNSDTDLWEANSERVCFGEDRESCVYVCAQLRAAGIPFTVVQHKHQFLKGVDERYDVFVPQDFRERAKAIAEEGRFDFSDTPEDQKIMELPAEDDSQFVENHKETRSWRREDATAEIWCEKTKDRAWFEKVEGLAWMIELSLSENRIRARIDVQDNSRKIFVLPEDESRALEIVREIQDGTPPT